MRAPNSLDFVLVLCFVAFLSACAEPPLLDSAAWLEGQWENRTPRGVIMEEWSRTDSAELAGRSWTMRGEETVVLETIRLVQEGDSLFYIPVVANQNEGQPVRFAMTEMTDEVLRFENPSHDFPQVISYRRVGADSLIAEISGSINGTARSVAFPMRRVDTD